MLKPITVKALPDYRIWIEFPDGVAGEVDLSHLVGHAVFRVWEDDDTFDTVVIGSQRQIVWSDEIEICSDALYLEITGQSPKEVFPALASETVHA